MIGHQRPRGLSLPEVLVVLGIILLLLCLLFPSLSGAREQARRTLCSHNLRQWGMALHEYRDDHRDYLPCEGTFLPDPLTGASGVENSHAWYNALPPYLGLPSYREMEGANVRMKEMPELHLWVCPSKNLSNAYRSASGKNIFHYAMNDVLDGMGSPPNGSVDTPGFPDRGDAHLRVSAVLRTSTVLLFDIADNSMFGSPRQVATKYYRNAFNRRVAKFHGDYANLLFVDGNVASCTIDDLVSDRDNRRGRIVWNHPLLYWGYPPRR